MKALVTRPEEDAATVAAALRMRGIEPILAPMLRIELEPDGATALMGALAGVQAVLFTSANGVRTFAAVCNRFEIPAYCVGDTSAAAARIAGFRVVASADGDAADLAKLVVSRLAPGNGALLHAAGHDTAGNLASAALSAAGFTVRRVVLYRAIAADRFAPSVEAALQHDEIGFVLFFSLRTAETFVRLVEESELGEHCDNMAAVCLSQNVAAALNGAHWRAVAVAQSPTLPALLTALDETIAA